MGGWLIIWVGLILAGLAAGGFISVPKGENQVVIRTSILLVVTCCYLMQVHTPSSAWAITYLAQLNPLIRPRRSDLRLQHSD
ncbi:BQ5605_C009g05555 [Microbotryum silenes-dioicae]|uniref:BQ5605_C009g05555 protein n=1 Tax=Microbotryum silenes-dioicae TaxID=796604 RepID=A0A2X0P8S3_9BASI|nr:BQ5605_C009g05555 [Microbotryum silenes-dioicae]